MFDQPGYWSRPHHPLTHMGATFTTSVSPPRGHRHHHHQLSISFLLNPVEPAGDECARGTLGPAAHPQGGESRPTPLQANCDRSCPQGKVSIHSLLQPPEMTSINTTSTTTSGGSRTSPSCLPSTPQLLSYPPSVSSPRPSYPAAASSPGTTTSPPRSPPQPLDRSHAPMPARHPACSKHGTRRNHQNQPQHQQAHRAAAMNLFEPLLELQRREEHLIQQREKYLILETQRLELRKQLTQLQIRLGHSGEAETEHSPPQHRRQHDQQSHHKRRRAGEDGERAEAAVAKSSKRRRRDTTKADGDDGEQRHRGR